MEESTPEGKRKTPNIWVEERSGQDSGGTAFGGGKKEEKRGKSSLTRIDFWGKQTDAPFSAARGELNCAIEGPEEKFLKGKSLGFWGNKKKKGKGYWSGVGLLRGPNRLEGNS